MKYQTLLSIGIVCGLAAVAFGNPLDKGGLGGALDTVIEKHPTSRRTTVSLKVIDLETGATLYDRFGERLFTPASNLKIYTSACALDVFGPEHRFVTRLRYTGVLDDSTLRGDLVLVGGGDAMLTHEALLKLARNAVDDFGLRQITGKVRVDNSRYSSPLKGPGWMWDDDPRLLQHANYTVDA